MTSLIVTIVFGSIWAIYIGYAISKIISLRSKSKIWKPIRRLYWSWVIEKTAEYATGYKNYKVRVYFTSYLRKSLAAKEYYINNGYDSFRLVMIGKIEEIEREVEKWKYNTFGNVTWEEEEFIKNYIKKEKDEKTNRLRGE